MLLFCWHLRLESWYSWWSAISCLFMCEILSMPTVSVGLEKRAPVWQYCKKLELYNCGWCDMLSHVFGECHTWYFVIYTMNQIKTSLQYTAQFTSTIHLDVSAYNSVSCSEIDLIHRNLFQILWKYCGEAILILQGRTNNIAAGQEVSSVFYHFHKTCVLQVHDEIHNKIASHSCSFSVV